MTSNLTTNGLHDDIASYMIKRLHNEQGGDWLLINRDEKPRDFRFTDGKRVMIVVSPSNKLSDAQFTEEI